MCARRVFTLVSDSACPSTGTSTAMKPAAASLPPARLSAHPTCKPGSSLAQGSSLFPLLRLRAQRSAPPPTQRSPRLRRHHRRRAPRQGRRRPARAGPTRRRGPRPRCLTSLCLCTPAVGMTTHRPTHRPGSRPGPRLSPHRPHHSRHSQQPRMLQPQLCPAKYRRRARPGQVASLHGWVGV